MMLIDDGDVVAAAWMDGYFKKLDASSRTRRLEDGSSSDGVKIVSME